MSWERHGFTFSIMVLIFSKIETKKLAIFEISTFPSVGESRLAPGDPQAQIWSRPPLPNFFVSFFRK